MPKILINERDRTSPGTPTSYDNFTVLIAGFEKSLSAIEKPELREQCEKKRAKLKDTNGAYEFSSTADFKEVVGLVPPEIPDLLSLREIPAVYHYGNQMAYELLKLGYPIIYKVITSVNDLENEAFWECFKDKASYDFRFITHGLLASCNSDEVSAMEAERSSLVQAHNLITDILALTTEGGEELSPEDKEKAFAEFVQDYDVFKNPEYDPTDAESKEYYEFAEVIAEVPGEKSLYQKINLDIVNLNNCLKDVPTATLINNANRCIADIANYKAAGTGDDTYNDMTMTEIPGRGDCVALIELDELIYTGASELSVEARIIEGIKTLNSSSLGNGQGKYCALTVPSVVYNMTVDEDFNENTKFPGAFHYLACFANSLNLGFAEWYAAAGYTRGVSNYSIKHTTVKLGEIAINALEPRNIGDAKTADYPPFACNVIACFRGSYYLWGNRTAHPLGDKNSRTTGDLVASSFLNIRQLCITIKKQLYVACRSFTFDPNSDTLWINFKNAIKPTLEAMKADLGIRDYKIIKVRTDKKATLKAKIRIIPIEAVEDFDLEISLEDSFGETTAVVTE
jgi:hypothetical protein